MSSFIALLRAVNVGGTGKLQMSALRSICEELGFTQVATYIASGNVYFQSKLTEAKVKAALEGRLRAHGGTDTAVMVRTPVEMRGVHLGCPWPDAPPNKTYAIFLDHAPPKDALTNVTGRAGEELALGPREIYVRYPEGAGASKLRIVAAKTGTARNMNTVAKLADLAAAL